MFIRNRRIYELLDELDLRIAIIQTEQKRLNDLIEDLDKKTRRNDTNTVDKYADYRTPDGLLTKRKFKED